MTCLGLVWTSSANWAVFSPTGCRSCQFRATSQPLRRESSTFMNCMCAHTRRLGWITDCFIRDRETLCGKMSRTGGGGALSQSNETHRHTLKQRDWCILRYLTALSKNILHAWQRLVEEWGDKRREKGWMSERPDRLQGLLMSCVCARAAWGLKGHDSEDRIHDYYWFRTRLGAGSSSARRRTGFTASDQMKMLSHN